MSTTLSACRKTEIKVTQIQGRTSINICIGYLPFRQWQCPYIMY